MRKAIILLGAPGAGKGTQADKISDMFELIHLETSKIIEEGFERADPNDARIKEEKERKAVGLLTRPSLFAEWFNEKVRELASADKGIVTSGSLRTVEETELILPELERLYGKENVGFFLIDITEDESVKRNSVRRVCKANKHTIPSGDYAPEYKDITSCPYDGSELVSREDDKAEIIKKRFGIYIEQTTPVVDYLEKRGYKVVKIHGEQKIDEVFVNIKEWLSQKNK